MYVGWDHHTLYCSAHAMLVSPQQTFQEFFDQQMQAVSINILTLKTLNGMKCNLLLNKQVIQPRPEQTLAEIGFDQKSLLRFVTPGLNGYKGAHVKTVRSQQNKDSKAQSVSTRQEVADELSSHN